MAFPANWSGESARGLEIVLRETIKSARSTPLRWHGLSLLNTRIRYDPTKFFPPTATAGCWEVFDPDRGEQGFSIWRQDPGEAIDSLKDWWLDEIHRSSEDLSELATRLQILGNGTHH